MAFLGASWPVSVSSVRAEGLVFGHLGGLRGVRNASSNRRRAVILASAEVGSQAPASGLAKLLSPDVKERFIFVGGKGGVGKTTTSASLAIRFAESGLRTLVLSTDPAHSLGDSLEVDLTSGNLVSVADDLPLDAMEIDTSAAVKDFQETIGALGIKSSKWSETLGLDDLKELLSTLPPGADEFIALTKVMTLAQSGSYDRVVIDTAPTGHTLRLLSFPDFLSNFLEKATSLREKLKTAQSLFSAFTGSVSADDVVEKINAYRAKLEAVSDLFRDPSRAEFIIVTIPTKLAVAESTRLLESLRDEGVWVNSLVLNQVLSEDANQEAFSTRSLRNQKKWIDHVKNKYSDISVHLVNQFDSEVRGFYGLKAFGMVAFKDSESWAELLSSNQAQSSKPDFVFVGGKGGVGKTTTSAALGAKLAENGRKTLVISTDPAHSLGDALDLDISGGKPVAVPESDGMLWGLEVDTKAAVDTFRELVQSLAVEGTGGLGGDLARKFGIDEFAGILDSTPPGTDELVALTKVVRVIKDGSFESVVVDTAPTGHTLRLLSFPEFLDGFLGQVISLKSRLDGAIDKVKSVMGGGNKIDDDIGRAQRGIQSFRDDLVELRAIFQSEESTQFCVVTIPTAMGVLESERLINSLDQMTIKVRHIIINQTWPEAAAESFTKRRQQEQSVCIGQLEETSSTAGGDLNVSKVPYFDTEVRGRYGLRAIGQVLFPER